MGTTKHTSPVRVIRLHDVGVSNALRALRSPMTCHQRETLLLVRTTRNGSASRSGTSEISTSRGSSERDDADQSAQLTHPLDGGWTEVTTADDSDVHYDYS